MGTQYIEDPQTKEKIAFEWDKKEPPTSADIDSLYAAARGRSKEEQRRADKYMGQPGLKGWNPEGMKIDPKEAIRTGYQVTGAVVGGAAGAASPTPGGAFIGGTLGYAGFNKLADIMLGDRNPSAPDASLGRQAWDQLYQTGGDVLTGAAYETMGPAFNMLGKKALYPADQYLVKKAGNVKNWLSGVKPTEAEIRASNPNFVTNKTTNFLANPVQRYTERKAATMLDRARTNTPGAASQIEANAIRNEAVENEIPGFRFNTAQKGGDPGLLSLARAKGQSATGPGIGLSEESRMGQNQAIGNYIGTKIKGRGDVGDFLKSVQETGANFRASTERTKMAAEDEAARLRGRSFEETGTTLRDMTRQRRDASSGRAAKILQKVDGKIEIPTERLYQEQQEIYDDYMASIGAARPGSRPMDALEGIRSLILPKEEGEAASAIVDKFGNPIKSKTASSGVIDPNKMTIDQIRELSSRLTTGSREARAAGKHQLAHFYDRLETSVNETLAAAAEGPGPMVKVDNPLFSQRGGDLRQWIYDSGGIDADEAKLKALGINKQQEIIQQGHGDLLRKGGMDLSKKAQEAESEGLISVGPGESPVQALFDQLNRDKALYAGQTRKMDVQLDNPATASIEALKEFKDYWRDVHVPTFRHGPTGEILEKKYTGEWRVTDPSVAGKWFKPGNKGESEFSAKAFQKVFGNDPKARGLVRDYAAQSLLNAARSPSGELSGHNIQRWLWNHRAALESFGIKNEFGSLSAAMKQVDKAMSLENKFNKESLSRALNGDPDKAIATMLSGTGKKDSITQMKKMVWIARQDKSGAALEGLRAGIGEYFESSVQQVASDLANNNLMSLAKATKFVKTYGPAFEQSGLYSPQQMKAWHTVVDALEGISKQAKPYTGYAGSDTADLLQRAGAAFSAQASHVSRLYSAFNKGYSMLTGSIQRRVEDAATRALFDPEYAEKIARLMKPGVETKAFQKATKQLDALDMMRGRATTGAAIGAVPLRRGEKPPVMPPELRDEIGEE